MTRWYNKVEEAGLHSFNVITATFYEHYDEILNFYNNRSSNALAESFNAEIKLLKPILDGLLTRNFCYLELLIFTLSHTKKLLSPF